MPSVSLWRLLCSQFVLGNPRCPGNICARVAKELIVTTVAGLPLQGPNRKDRGFDARSAVLAAFGQLQSDCLFEGVHDHDRVLASLIEQQLIDSLPEISIEPSQIRDSGGA